MEYFISGVQLLLFVLFKELFAMFSILLLIQVYMHSGGRSQIRSISLMPTR
jgi:hypothetical protein